MKSTNSSKDSLTFWEHVADFRSTLFYITLFFVAAVSLVHAYRELVITFLLRPLGSNTPYLQFLSPLDPLYFILKVDFMLGFVLTLPVIVLLLWQFLSPDLTLKSTILPLIIALSVFTLSGFAFGYSYLLVTPLILDFVGSIIIPGTVTAFTALGYLSFFLSITLILVLVFQTPLIIALFSSLGILNPFWLAQKRAYLITGAFILSAVLTPTTDIFTLFLVGIPFIVAIEVGLLIGKLLYPSSQKLQ